MEQFGAKHVRMAFAERCVGREAVGRKEFAAISELNVNLDFDGKQIIPQRWESLLKGLKEKTNLKDDELQRKVLEWGSFSTVMWSKEC